MSQVTLYGFPASTYVRTARMALEEKGVAYDLEPLAPHSPEIDAINPFGKIPAFRHGELTLFETIAIACYVDEAFDGPPLQPKDGPARARMLQWMSAYVDNTYPALFPLVLQRLVVPGRGGTPDEGAVAEAVPKARRQMEVFDGALDDSPWLVGADFTLADLLLPPMIFYLRMMPESETLLGNLGNLKRWYDAVAERASFAATMPPTD